MTTNMNKMYKPGECMKHITVEMHPALLDAWYCADVRRELTSVGAKVQATNAICDPALVLWARDLPPDGVFSSSRQTRCDCALYILLAEAAAPLVQQRQLAATVRAAAELAGARLTLAILRPDNYFRKSGRKTLNSGSNKMTEIELEMAITDLLVTAKVDTAVVSSPGELALLILQLTKALAEAPHKKAKRELDEKAEYYMRGANKECISIDKDGAGCPRLWQQMLVMLPNASLEISRAIVAQYNTPQALYQAVQLPNAIQEIADIGVERSLVPGARARRVGPEFARRLHTLFTADDGDEVID